MIPAPADPPISGVRRAWSSDPARFWLCLGVIFVFALAIGVRFIDQSYDDAFITYRYARNLALGHGMVYNVGQRFFGVTAPLYTLVLGLLGWLTNPDWIPRISAMISAASLGATGAGLLQICRRRDCLGLGFLASLLYLSNPYVHACFGTEMIAQIALAVWACAMLQVGKYSAAITLGCLTALVRPDGLAILPVLLAGIAYKERKLPAAQVGLAIAILAPFAIWSYAYYGTVLPETVHAKMLQGAGGAYLARAAEHYQKVALGAPFKVAAYLLLDFAAVGLLFVPRYRFFIPLLAWVALKELGYQAIGSAFYNWYLFPVHFGIAVLAAMGLYGLSTLASKATPIAWGSPAVVAAIVLAGWRLDTRTLAVPDVRQGRYLAIARWLRGHTPPSTSVAGLEIGWLGYESERPIVDLWGLVIPGVAEHQSKADFDWVYRTYQPDIVLIDNHLLPSYRDRVVKASYFASHYEPRAELRYQPWKPITVYVRKDNREAIPAGTITLK